MESALKRSARAWLLNELKYDRSNPALESQMQSKDLHDLLTSYLNWTRRRIMPASRKIRRSQAYMDNPIRHNRINVLSTIETDIGRGADLTKYLSRGIEIAADIETKKLNRRRDLDLMLNSWGVHHLHISTDLEQDGFVARDGPVLFAVFTSSVAYLIDIMQHGDWARDHVLQTIADEWPAEGLIHEVGGAVRLAVSYTEEERKSLRSHAINTAIELNGRVYYPAGFLSTVGVSFDASRDADRITLALEYFEDRLQNDRSHFESLFRQNGHTLPDIPKFSFFLFPSGAVGFIEQHTKVAVALG